MDESQRGSLARYAVTPEDGGARLHVERAGQHAWLRDPFELDRHRVVESTAFRRLEGKTQVFAPDHHDHFRTRLTHTLEASLVARCLASVLSANETLAEVITLAHDLGHPPFGHAGGFNHNVHSLRVVDFLEHPFPQFRGLNLTVETRSGLWCHRTAYDVPGDAVEAGDTAESRESCRGPAPEERCLGYPPRERGGSEPARRPSVEAQIASLADRLAYDVHDLEDAIGAELIGVEELNELDLWREALVVAGEASRGRSLPAMRRGVLDALLDSLLANAIEASRPLLAGLDSLAAVRARPGAVVILPAEADARLRALEALLARRVYQHPELRRVDEAGRRTVRELFAACRAWPVAMPDRFVQRIDALGLDRVIADYIAGMTDAFCRRCHAEVVR